MENFHFSLFLAFWLLPSLPTQKHRKTHTIALIISIKQLISAVEFEKDIADISITFFITSFYGTYEFAFVSYLNYKAESLLPFFQSPPTLP